VSASLLLMRWSLAGKVILPNQMIEGGMLMVKVEDHSLRPDQPLSVWDVVEGEGFGLTR
jgi:hypothetical protein